MKDAIEAIYENGTFRPLHPEAITMPNGQVVRLTIEEASAQESLQWATGVYSGLSEREIDEIEQIALQRGNFFGTRSSE